MTQRWIEDGCAMREHLFLSHANPEDNEFTRWLALRLSVEGFRVWCDLTELLGGEDFWTDAEDGIRAKTAKLLYVLSRSSNHKQGVNNELQVAQQVARAEQLKDFVIPLRIDDLPHSEFNIRLASLNAIDFGASWESGLRSLIAKLEKDQVPRADGDGPLTAASWWNRRSVPLHLVYSKPEDYLSNWFPISSLPPKIYFHELVRNGVGPLSADVAGAAFPAQRHGVHVVSFAEREMLGLAFDSHTRLGKTSSYDLADFLEGSGPWSQPRRRDARDILAHLLSEAWLRELRRRGMQTREMANGGAVSYFTKALTGHRDRVATPGGTARHGRSVVGYRTVLGGGRRYWHLALQGRPIVHPQPSLIVSLHVLFSDEGTRIWSDARRLHAARRSQCKDWWNDDWRDRLLGAMAWLADEANHVTIPLAPDACMLIDAAPTRFRSPLTYSEQGAVRDEDLFDDDREDDADADVAT